MNILKKVILKMAVSFGLIFCLGAAANANFLTVEVTSDYGDIEESAAVKALHSFAVYNKICEENNFSDDILKMLSTNLLGANKDFSQFNKECLDVSEEEYQKIKKAFEECRKEGVNLTKQEVEKSHQKLVKMMKEQVTILNNFAEESEKVTKNGQKCAEQFIIDNLKNRVRAAKDALNKGGLADKEKAILKARVGELKNILEDKAKLKEYVEESISGYEKSEKFYKENYIPAMETKLNIIKGLSAKSMNIETLNKNFVLTDILF